ncbi:MAG: hypothetical protein JRD89_02690, partial [Deltaproteobacteria bacterium]|nr:hypothetical protein [Deltaproteobacteria bacterium]
MVPNTDVNNLEPGTGQSDHSSHLGHAGKSIQKIAVLFTDIIGSTRFFQSHGNLAGRSMLEKHENIVSKTIIKFGGTVVKNLGDSILAYFADSQEATKAAIQIQKDFSRYNKRRGAEHKIHVRIGIHFDEGIVEDKDIFGNAVNIASKITHLTPSNQILISNNVFDLVSTVPSRQFEAFEIPDHSDAPPELSLYRVLWEESTDLAPAMIPVLYMRPVRELEVDTFDTLWNDLIEGKVLLWNDRIGDEAITDDQTVILTTKRLSTVMDVATDVWKFLRGNIQVHSVVPVQIIIDAGPCQGIDKLAREGLQPGWEELNPGTIFISPAAYQLIEEEGLSIANTTPPGKNQPQAFYEIAPDDYNQKEDEVLFLHQDALSQGDNPPCFYCGSKGHAAHDCPSKNLPAITGVLKKVGYLSFDRISDMFHMYLMSPEEVKRKEILLQGESGGEELSAGLGFYELKQIFQLRFFKSIWDSHGNDWDKVATAKDTGAGTVELIRLAQDCIRVSNLPRAESLLKACLEKHPDDYRTHCTLSFLNIEKGSPDRSEQHLDTALLHARTVPQKIFILFLLSRLYVLADNPRNALKKIREIKNIQPYRPEAIYQEIILSFKQGDQDAALARLMSLIRTNRDYYINALIDPDLAPFNSVIHPQLKKLFTEIRQKAQKKAYDAEREFSSLEQFLVDGDDETEKAATLLSKIRTLVSTDSYFGYMDIADLGDSVISVCRGAKARRKKEFMNTVETIQRLLGTIFRLSMDYRSQLFPTAAYQQLMTVQSNFKEILEAVTFNDFRRFREMSAQSEEILKKLDG